MTPADGEMDRLVRVLRLGEGDAVEVFDGAGRRGKARVKLDPDNGNMCLAPDGEISGPAPVSLPVVLFQAIPKSSRMDWLVEKATELGVSGIHPLLTERGLVRPSQPAEGNRLQRWRRIAQQAARQCGLARVPAIEAPLTMATALEMVGNQAMAGIYGSLEADALPLCRAIPSLKKGAMLALFIGPEGDFSPSESSRLRAAGLTPVTLGPRVLRVETAAIAALCTLGAAIEGEGC